MGGKDSWRINPRIQKNILRLIRMTLTCTLCENITECKEHQGCHGKEHYVIKSVVPSYILSWKNTHSHSGHETDILCKH